MKFAIIKEGMPNWLGSKPGFRPLSCRISRKNFSDDLHQNFWLHLTAPCNSSYPNREAPLSKPLTEPTVVCAPLASISNVTISSGPHIFHLPPRSALGKAKVEAKAAALISSQVKNEVVSYIASVAQPLDVTTSG